MSVLCANANVTSIGSVDTEVEDTKLPFISILLATYEPRLDWLAEQLDSINSQTYPNLRLYVCDDCSPTVPYKMVEALVAEHVTTMPSCIVRNVRTLGSNGTFERLTLESEGDYFAYCDQDDVWLPHKLATLLNAVEREGAALVCSDMLIIDAEGRQIADSITKVRRHHVFRSGSDLAAALLVSNFVTGCAALVRADVARDATPFCPHMVHDHWLALYAAKRGRIVSLPDRLVKYRIHGSNQTLMMAGVVDRESYYRIRVLEMVHRMEWLCVRFSEGGELLAETQEARSWARARDAWFRGDCAARRTVLVLRRFSPLTSFFEAALAHGPERLFMAFVEAKRRNWI